MAIIPSIPGITVSVEVAGQTATEYEPPDGDIPTDPDQGRCAYLPACHRYIESKTGAAFNINVQVASDFSFAGGSDVLTSHVFIDGTREGHTRIQKEDVPTNCRIRRTARFEPALNQRVYKGFAFAPVTTNEDTDSYNIARDARRAKNLGTIKVVVELGTFAGYKATGPSTHRTVDSNDSLKLSEKAMKGKELSHGAIFVTIPGRPYEPKSSRTVVKDSFDIGVFYFHYRSRDALDHEMIIPRSPPASAPVKVIEDLTNSDDEGVKVKPDPPARVKRERDDESGPKMPFKMVKLSDGREAIDLTDD